MINRRRFLQYVGGLTVPATLLISKQNQKPKEDTEKADLFVALFCDSREVSGNNYHRVKIQNENRFRFNSNGDLVNNNDIIFPKVKEDWGRITHFALSAESIKEDGLFVIKGTVVNSPLITNGDVIQFSAGDLQIEL